MRKLIISLAVLLITSCGISQETAEDLILLNKGNALYSLVFEDMDFDFEIHTTDSISSEGKIKISILKEQKEEILEVALKYFEELINDYPKSDLIYRALNNAALIYDQLDNTDQAIKYYKKILTSDANDHEKGGIGKGIMAEPYALYKNRACKSLAELYLQQKDFDSALKYIRLTEKYPYKHFCGNEYAANDIYMATLYARSYYGLNEVEKALSYSLPHIFNNSLASNTEIVELTVRILKENKDYEKLISDFENSVKNYYSETFKTNDSKWIEYNIDFMGVKIEIPNYTFEFGDEKEIIGVIKESYFYKLLKKDARL
ncbi:tetratricopeptide repeat protein [Flavobacteriaceae bacterium M23B6Z8]